ncbi:hypothetical protein P8452_61206 [Trifolium repens]|nr:hypothetical protein QL285_038662 [Trifolium repens]WJX77940.1 hypothetical protein P8452_61206 [Trifolium repens]
MDYADIIVILSKSNINMEAQAMMAPGLIYSEKVMENIAKERAASNIHQVYIHNRAQSVFSVKELVRPTSGRPTGTFRVVLKKQWCDCGEFQTLHYPCSHLIAACSHVHLDFMKYVSPQYTLQYVFNTYLEEFQAIPLSGYWPEYTRVKLYHNPTMRRDPKGHPQSTRIHTEMDLRESSRQQKSCGLCRTPGHNKSNCPNRPNANVTEET